MTQEELEKLPALPEASHSQSHRAWRQHCELLQHVDPYAAEWRGCIGLAAVLVRTDDYTGAVVDGHVMLADRDIVWASLVDLPAGAGCRGTPVHYAAASKTATRFSVPMIATGGDGVGFDFRRIPLKTGLYRTETGVLSCSPQDGTLDPGMYPQLFRVFNALEWAMTTTAFFYRSRWKMARTALLQSLQVSEPVPETQGLFLFGAGNPYNSIEPPMAWAPRPYLAFLERDRPVLFDMVTLSGMRSPGRFYSPVLRAMFCEAARDRLRYRAKFAGRVLEIGNEFDSEYNMALRTIELSGDHGESETVRVTGLARLYVKPGQRFSVGTTLSRETFDLPSGYGYHASKARWEDLQSVLGNTRELLLRLWFDTQVLQLRAGFVHVAAALSSTAAPGATVDDELVWDVSAAEEYLSDDCEAFIFPTIRQSRWSDFIGSLPGDVAYNLTPPEPWYVEGQLDQ